VSPRDLNDDRDVELMRLLAGGDKTALAELIKRHQQYVFELAYRVSVNRSLAEDIAQETFFSGMAVRSYIRIPSPLSYLALQYRGQPLPG